MGRTMAPTNPLPFAGLRFSVYARKSIEDARHEDHKSVARQRENAARYVEARGGAVLPECIYTDDDVSGAEFRNRPGLLRLLDAARNGRPFDAVVMMDGSRLGREQIETSWTLKQMTDGGLRVFYYQTDTEARLAPALDKMVMTLDHFAAETERERARLRSREKAEAQARHGHVTGGVVYGYDNVKMKGDRPFDPAQHPGDVRHDYVVRRVNPAEAEVVRGMFRMSADGFGLMAIAKALNAAPAYAPQTRAYFGGRRVAPPRHGTGSWAPTAVREILRRPLYKGAIVWGRTTKVDKGGRASVTVKADRKLVEVPAPDLRIVDDALWVAVQRRLKAVGEAYLRDAKGRLQGHPDRPDLRNEGGYLLSGLARCATCGWNIIVRGGPRAKTYACGHYVKRGPTVCGNSLAQPVPVVDAAVLAALEREALRPEVFGRALRRAVDLLRERLAKDPDRVPALRREKAALERKIGNMVRAIGDGRGPAALVQEIEAGEARFKEIDADLAALEAAPKVAALDIKRLQREVEATLPRFADLLRANVPRARQALKKLLPAPLEFAPVDAGNGKRAYRFRGELTFGPILAATACNGTPWGHHIFLTQDRPVTQFPLEGVGPPAARLRRDERQPVHQELLERLPRPQGVPPQ